MKKILCGIMIAAACAGALMGYYEVNSDPNMRGNTPSDMRKATPRSRATIEADIKNTETKIHELDKKIAQERNTVTKMSLQKERAGRATHLRKLEDELMGE